jgi:hypothetical protein
MSEFHAESKNVEAAPIFTGTARWLIAVVLIMGPLLQAIEFVLAGGEKDNEARVAFWSAFPSQTGLSMASGLLAVPFLLGGIAVIIALTRTHSRRLAWLAGAFMTAAMVGLAAVHGYELAAFGLALAGNPTGATSVLNAESLGLPGAVLLLLFLGGAVLGTLTLAIVAWRSPYIPRIVVLFMLGFAILDFAASQGVVSHLVNLVGFIILAVAVLNGYSRGSRPVSTPAAEVGS